MALLSRQLLGVAWVGLLSCLQPTTPSPQPAPWMGAIPQAFLGEWNTTLEACGSPRSEGRLILEHHHATFFSSKAEVMQVMEENPRRIFVRLRFPGQADAGVGSGPINGAIKEGAAPFTLERRYLLSSNLQRLQDISQGEQGLSRWRCPSGKR